MLKSPIESGMNTLSSSGSYKRARAASNSLQVPSCLVDGCVADLSLCREYHRRHKVCEAHSKTSRVTIEGHKKRFCQQCSRFHSLDEFDDGKRSCRKRLDGHNRRRRKPQPDSSSLYSSEYIVNHQGSKFASYGSQSYAPTSSWDDAVKEQNNHGIYSSQLNFTEKGNHFDICFSQGYRGEKQFPFLQDAADPPIHISQPHSKSNSTMGNVGSNNNSSRKLMFSDGFDRVTDSDRASSLLSSSSSSSSLTETPRPFSSTCFVQRPTQSSSVPSTQYNDLVMDAAAAAMHSVSVAENGIINYANMTCPEVVQTGPGACRQTISFSWR